MGCTESAVRFVGMACVCIQINCIAKERRVNPVCHIKSHGLALCARNMGHQFNNNQICVTYVIAIM